MSVQVLVHFCHLDAVSSIYRSVLLRVIRYNRACDKLRCQHSRSSLALSKETQPPLKKLQLIYS